jgi:hypothetical protein
MIKISDVLARLERVMLELRPDGKAFALLEGGFSSI